MGSSSSAAGSAQGSSRRIRAPARPGVAAAKHRRLARDAGDGGGGEQPVRRAVAQERQRDEGQGGERRVGERQPLTGGEPGQPSVQIAAVQQHPGTGAVDVQIDAVAAQANAVAGLNEVDRRGGQVQRHDQRESPAREVRRRPDDRRADVGWAAEGAHGDLLWGKA